MTEGRQRSEWSLKSALMALIANTQRDPKKTSAFRPSDYDWFARTRAIPKAGIRVLKTVFIDKKMPREDLLSDGSP